MAKTSFILEADEAKAVAAFLKVVEAQGKATEGLRKMNREAAQTTQGAADLGNAFKSILPILGIGGGIAGAIASLREQTRLWGEDVTKVSQKFIDATKETLRAISQGGDIGQLMGKQLEQIMPNLQPTERTRVYTSLRRELPFEDIGTVLKLAEQAGKATLIGEPAEFAGGLGVMQQITGGKYTAGDVADMTLAVNKMLGGQAEQLGGTVFREAKQLTATGMQEDKALALGVAAAQQGQLRGLGALTGKLTEEKYFEPHKLKGAMSAQEKIEREFYGMAPEGRYEWLLANRGKGGKAAAVFSDQGVLNAIAEVNTAEIAARIKEARDIDYFDSTRAALLATKGGKDLQGAEILAGKQTAAETKAGEKYFDVETIKKLHNLARTRAFGKGGFLANPAVQKISGEALDTDLFLGDIGKVSPIFQLMKLLPLMMMNQNLTPKDIQDAFHDKKTAEEQILSLKENTKALNTFNDNLARLTGATPKRPNMNVLYDGY